MKAGCTEHIWEGDYNRGVRADKVQLWGCGEKKGGNTKKPLRQFQGESSNGEPSGLQDGWGNPPKRLPGGISG